MKKKQKNFRLLLKIKKVNPDDFSDYMKKIKPNTYTQTKKLICDCSNKKNYLIQYRRFKFYVRDGMVVEKVHEIFSFKQNKWLQKNFSFNSQKRKRAKSDFDKDFLKLLVNAAFVEMMENVRNRLNKELNKKYGYKKLLNNKKKLTFNGIHKSYENLILNKMKFVWINQIMLVSLY